MLRHPFLPIVIIALLMESGVAADINAAEEAALKKVLLVGIDGCRPDALRTAETPHLDQFICEGAFADDTQILGDRYTDNDTISGPGWSSILTGVWADKHGVNGNEFRNTNYEDQLVDKVLQALWARQTYGEEDWLILVGTDHGGQGTGHGDGQNVPEIRTGFLIASGPTAARGKIVEPTFIVDIVATALVHLGVNIDLAWKLDGRPVGLKQE